MIDYDECQCSTCTQRARRELESAREPSRVERKRAELRAHRRKLARREAPLWDYNSTLLAMAVVLAFEIVVLVALGGQ